jgi:hypothetical protein
MDAPGRVLSRFVVIDEAFGRGSTNRRDTDWSSSGGWIYSFLIVTPLQKIHIIEPFIASVGFVHNEDGRISMLRNLTIEEPGGTGGAGGMSSPWTTPADLRAQVERHWRSGRLLTGEIQFPVELRLRRPESRDLSERFEEVRTWIRELESEPACRIEWVEIDHRVLGRNRIPARIFVDTQNDALGLIGRSEDAARFRALAAVTTKRMPELSGMARAQAAIALEYAADWDACSTLASRGPAAGSPAPARYRGM